MKVLKRLSVLALVLLFCSAMMICASAATIPADGSIWTPSDEPTQTPTQPSTPNDSDTDTHSIVVERAENGTVKANRSSAKAGTTITITVVPEDGYDLGQLQVVSSFGKEISVKKVSDSQYTFVMPDSKVTVRATFTVQSSCLRDASCPMSAFTDLIPTAWYHDGVHYCLEEGLMNGVGGSQFDPNGSTTRAMLVTVLWRLEGSPIVSTGKYFSDVPAGQWYTNAIAWASANNIVNGYGDSTFGPANQLTREQVMAIFNRYAAAKGAASDTGLSTVLQYFCSDWAKNDVRWADANGLLDNLGVDVTDMTAPASRAELATYLHRVIENIMK